VTDGDSLLCYDPNIALLPRSPVLVITLSRYEHVETSYCARTVTAGIAPQ
jgi:hypothetical protein